MKARRTSGLRVRRCLAASVALGAATLGAAQAADSDEVDAEPVIPLAAPAAAFALARTSATQPDAPRFSFEGSVEPLTGSRPRLRQGGVSTTLVDVSNRVWLGWGRAAFGVGFGGQTPRIDQPVGTPLDATLQPTRPSMSFGMRYAFTPTSQFYAGATAARAWGNDDDLPRYNAKAGVEWKVARSRIGFDGGRLGVQLDSGYRMSIRTRSGGVQLALRRSF